MGQLNLYYRAFKEYRKLTLEDKKCIKQRQNVKQYPSDEDKLEAIRNSCIIDKEWVEEIENGLTYIEQAIAEERQFIKNEGEVLEIEKVKRVSKESVEHLARHSDLLTHVPEDPDGDLIPDKIYMVERLSDYTVYENRFLYMLLCYLRDFIQIRLKKIKELGNLYQGSLNIQREITTPSGSISFRAELNEKIKNNLLSEEEEEHKKMVDRIESCLHVVVSLLLKPLMVIVSKTPMIKPPITKTNVLKMNNKFKNALRLYEYLVSYQGDGFEIIEHKKSISPFTDGLVDELAEIVNLTSFLTYEYGNDLNSRLKKEYQAELKEEEKQEREALLKRLTQMKKKFDGGKIEAEEYLCSLEDAISSLKKENLELKEKEKEFIKLQGKHLELEEEKDKLTQKLSDTERESEQKSEFIDELSKKLEVELDEAEKKRVRELQSQSEMLQNEFNGRYSELEERYNALSDKHYLVSARLHANTGKGELSEEDYSSEENFAELEREFTAFYDMFIEKWKSAKKQIRQEMLWSKFKKVRAKIDSEE